MKSRNAMDHLRGDFPAADIEMARPITYSALAYGVVRQPIEIWTINAVTKVSLVALENDRHYAVAI